MAGVKQNQIDPSDPRILNALPSDPVTGAGKGAYYPKEVAGVVELFYKDSSGNVIQITSGGAILGGGGGSSTLTGLSDTNISSPSNGQALVYNGSQWVNTTLAGGGDLLASNNLSDVANASTALANLGGLSSTHAASVGNHTDVNLTGITSGQYLRWNGSQFVGDTPAGGGDLLASNNLSDVANASTALANLGGLSSTHAASVGNHTDVNLSGISDGQILKWNNSNSRFEPANESGGGGGSVSDVAYPTGWDGDTTQAASRNALFDKFNAIDAVLAQNVEFQIQLGAGSNLTEKINNAPTGGIPAGWSLVSADHGSVDASIAGSSDDLVLIHGLGQVAVKYSVTVLISGLNNYWQGNKLMASGSFSADFLATDPTNRNQTRLLSYNSGVGNFVSIIWVKFLPFLT